MADIKVDSLITTLEHFVNNDIFNNIDLIKNDYNSLAGYINSNPELSLLNQEIKTDLNSLSNQLKRFNSLFSDYLNDYIAVKKYLTDGSLSEVKSIPTINMLRSTPSIQNDGLKSIDVVNLNLDITYEEKRTHE